MKKINVKRAILENGTLRKEVKFGFSWGAFFLGFIYPLIKEDYMVAGISFVVISIASMIFFPLIFVLSMVFGFLYNKMYVKNLIKQGWHPFTEEDAQILRMNGILFDDKNNPSENNRERMAKKVEYYDMQPSEKTEVIKFKKNDSVNDFCDTSNNSMDNMNTDNFHNDNSNVPKMNYKNRTIQKFVARSIGGGFVSLVLGVFTANSILILLGAGLTGGGAFLAVKNKDKIRWK